jgi:putative transposon-encoded protein
MPMAKKKIAEQPMRIEMLGYEVVEKVAMPSGNSSRVYLPVDWEGTRVRAVRLEKKRKQGH